MLNLKDYQSPSKRGSMKSFEGVGHIPEVGPPPLLRLWRLRHNTVNIGNQTESLAMTAEPTLADLATQRADRGVYQDRRAAVLRDDIGPEIAGSRPLSKYSHELYAHERSFGTAITIAAERAGLSRRSGAGSKLEQDDAVKARIAFLAAQEKEVRDEKYRRLEQRQFLYHDYDPYHFYELVEEPWIDRKGDVICDEEGKPLMRKRQQPKALQDIPPELRQCIESISFTESGRINFKLYSKTDASRDLRKMNGFDAPSIEPGDEHSRLPDKEFFAELARQAAELGVNLKMTFEAMAE